MLAGYHAPMSKDKPMTYEDAGVSVDRGNALVEAIKPAVKATHRPGVMGGLGGFGALFDLSAIDYQQPILVTGTDGVGTKLKLAIESGRHERIGIDLVAMCVNDLLVQGAEPLFFLDYYACSKLDVEVAAEVVKGIAKGCELSGCALVGGETAEMPGLYQQDDYDLAGFCVGVVEKDRLIDGQNITADDVIIGLQSSGPHSNGYSLIRKLINDQDIDLSTKIFEQPLIDTLLEPTRIYVKPILDLLKTISVKGMAHITGGGLTENIPRVLPEYCHAELFTSEISLPPVFSWLQELGDIETIEMYKTFNCGVGMTLMVNAADEKQVLQQLQASGVEAHTIGRIIRTDIAQPSVLYV